MLINLKLPLTEEELDIALAAALCHDLKVYIRFPENAAEMTKIYGLDPRVPEIMNLIYEGDCVDEEDRLAIFDRLRQNRLAMLVRMADRSNLVEQLHDVSLWSAHQYIYETRAYYLPLCIYAREYYPELDTAVGVMQEKMRELIVASEIFVTRFEARQRELSEKILEVREENSRLRIEIRKKRQHMSASEI